MCFIFFSSFHFVTAPFIYRLIQSKKVHQSRSLFGILPVLSVRNIGYLLPHQIPTAPQTCQHIYSLQNTRKDEDVRRNIGKICQVFLMYVQSTCINVYKYCSVEPKLPSMLLYDDFSPHQSFVVAFFNDGRSLLVWISLKIADTAVADHNEMAKMKTGFDTCWLHYKTDYFTRKYICSPNLPQYQLPISSQQKYNLYKEVV